MSAWAVIGDGEWGRALARRLARAEHAVHLVGRRRIGARAPKDVEHTTDLGAALAGLERVIIAVPIDQLESMLTRAAPHLGGHHRVVAASRGLTPGTHLRASEALRAMTAVRQVAVLAGAADADALRRKTPAAVVIGSAFPAWAAEIQAALVSPSLRVYTNSDTVGVELANTMAAVLAVALGAARAMGVGASAEATALTRAVAEMDRTVQALGGQANTAYGLAGLGVLAELLFEGESPSLKAGAALAA
ncbi:MAG: NAD(P)-binding domain-containing protein, partial [Myxococcales bacterium]|nr:NAD(P)-binding domain-containing protein [Myxococcales bacterium]